MKDFYIADAAKFENGVITSIFAVAAKQIRPKKTGEPFLQLTLGDRSGQIEAKMWDNVADTMNGFEAGDCVKVNAEVNRYNGRFQLTIRKLRKTNEGEADPADFLPATTQDVEQMWAILRGKIASFQEPHLRSLVDSFLDDPAIAECLRKAPAAKSLHHAWIGGLLEHIVSLMELADRVAPHYPQVNRDLLLTGVALHDIGKVRELTYGNSFGYSLEGQLLGHITIGLGMVHEKMALQPDFPRPLSILVEHLILSHHGQYEYGSPKLPMIPEAMMLHMLDDLDAKMQVMQAEFARHQGAGNDGTRMTDWVRAMERPLLDSARYLEETQTRSNPDTNSNPDTKLNLDEVEKADALPAEN